MENHSSSNSQIIPATTKDIKVIQSIAYKTWADTFGKILSPEQIDYMLKMMYSEKSLTEQMKEKKHLFYLIRETSNYLGYMSIETHHQNSEKTKIHKLYVLPQSQGKGVGKILLKKAEEDAQKYGDNTLSLNVNRFNKAVIFYEKVGFKITESEDIDIGNGFLMEDYIMEKEI